MGNLHRLFNAIVNVDPVQIATRPAYREHAIWHLIKVLLSALLLRLKRHWIISAVSGWDFHADYRAGRFVQGELLVFYQPGKLFIISVIDEVDVVGKTVLDR